MPKTCQQIAGRFFFLNAKPMMTEQLLTALRPLIGFRADPLAGTGADDLGPDLIQTSTGLTLDQCHELLKLSTLKASGPDGLDDLKAYLASSRDDAIRALLTNLDCQLAESGLAARLLTPEPIFKDRPAQPVPIVPTGRRVGLLLTALQSDVLIRLERIQAPAPMTVTLYDEDVTSAAIQIVINQANVWQNINLLLKAGHTYRLLYNESDLGGAIANNTVLQWPCKRNCSNCGPRSLGHYLCLKAMIETDPVVYSRDTNYGLNLVVSATADLSDRLLSNPLRLLTALRHQMAVTFLEKIAYSTRHNGPTEEAINGALFALTDKDNTDRVPPKLDKALSALVKALQAEAGAALDVDDTDDVTWSSL